MNTVDVQVYLYIYCDTMIVRNISTTNQKMEIRANAIHLFCKRHCLYKCLQTDCTPCYYLLYSSKPYIF